MTINTQFGFLAGKEFRSFYEFSLLNGGVAVIKAVVPINVVLKSVESILSEGQLRMETVVGGTEGGTFDVVLPIFNRNNLSTKPQPLYTTQVSLLSGGTHTGGTLLDLHINKTGVSANAIASVGVMLDDERGIAPNTYYFRLIATGITSGIYKIRWEERP